MGSTSILHGPLPHTEHHHQRVVVPGSVSVRERHAVDDVRFAERDHAREGTVTFLELHASLPPTGGEAALIQQMKIAGITDWQREYRFDPVRMWRLDFAWPMVKLGIEIHGGSFSGGRHVRGLGFAKDCEKMNALTLAGWRTLVYTTEQVKAGVALQHITDMLCGLGLAEQNSGK